MHLYFFEEKTIKFIGNVTFGLIRIICCVSKLFDLFESWTFWILQILKAQINCKTNKDATTIIRSATFFAKLSLNSTQSQLILRLRLALFPVSDKPPSQPATQPPIKVVGRCNPSPVNTLKSLKKRKVCGLFKITLRMLQDYLKFTSRPLSHYLNLKATLSLLEDHFKDKFKDHLKAT